MNPAPSVILFTVLSGAGFGLLAWLGALAQLSGWIAFFWWGLGYALAVGGLLASTFHLGNPQRFLLAYSQWRSSWLSREAWASTLTLLWLAPVVLSQWVGFDWPSWWGPVGGVMAMVTVFTTSMIYAQLKTVPRWNHWLVPVKFLAFSLAAGALLTGQGLATAWFLSLLGVALLAHWRLGDGAFTAFGQSLNTATGLGPGEVKVFEQAHTAGNYLLSEMMFVVGRKHRDRLRILSMVLAIAAPVVIILILPATIWTFGLASLAHLTGAMAARWLFFAEAEHVVGLYYGRR